MVRAVVYMTQALCYKLKGRGFEYGCGIGFFFNLPLLQPHYSPWVDSALTEICTRNPSGSKRGLRARLTKLQPSMSRWEMESSDMLRRVTLVRTDVSEDLSASIIRVARIGELGTLTVISNWRTLRRNTVRLTLFLVHTDSCHPDDGGAKFRRNVGSYKSHTA
jgi:hypothetical protein